MCLRSSRKELLPCTSSSFTAGSSSQSTQLQHKGHWAVWEEDTQVWKTSFERPKFKRVQEEREQSL